MVILWEEMLLWTKIINGNVGANVVSHNYTTTDTERIVNVVKWQNTKKIAPNKKNEFFFKIKIFSFIEIQFHSRWHV